MSVPNKVNLCLKLLHVTCNAASNHNPSIFLWVLVAPPPFYPLPYMFGPFGPSSLIQPLNNLTTFIHQFLSSTLIWCLSGYSRWSHSTNTVRGFSNLDFFMWGSVISVTSQPPTWRTRVPLSLSVNWLGNLSRTVAAPVQWLHRYWHNSLVH